MGLLIADLPSLCQRALALASRGTEGSDRPSVQTLGGLRVRQGDSVSHDQRRVTRRARWIGLEEDECSRSGSARPEPRSDSERRQIPPSRLPEGHILRAAPAACQRERSTSRSFSSFTLNSNRPVRPSRRIVRREQTVSRSGTPEKISHEPSSFADSNRNRVDLCVQKD